MVISVVQAKENQKIYLFYGQGCAHCALVEEYFETQDLYSKYSVEKKEIYFDRDNALLFSSLLTELGVPEKERFVPLVVIGDKVIVGDKLIVDDFVIEADKYLLANAGVDQQDKPNNELNNDPNCESNLSNLDNRAGLDLTLAAVIGASIVDAINPCAFAVLIILMSTILAAGDGKKALISGLAFASSIFISYFLMGLGLYKALELGGLSRVFFKTIGWIAIILGLLNLKDWLWYGKGVLMEVPLSWRPKLKSLLRSVTNPVGAFGIGFVISLFLLPCTSGPYIVILGMLANVVSQTKAIIYLIIYNLIFVLPMILISIAVYKGFDPGKAEEIRQKRLKTLHLVAGVIMLIMGIMIISGWI
ncbi:MAG: cytochrome c biogenesis protein CcdA [Patescibacteria group bacterium]